MPTVPYTLLINTCDAYEDAWGPLFTLFRRYWPSLDVPIVLNTETVVYQAEGLDIICPQLYRDHADARQIPWSRRLRETLSRVVETDLVLLYLDDFYIRRPVNTAHLDVVLRMMSQQPQIANTLLYPVAPPYAPVSEHPWLVKRAKRSPYLFSLQAGLWRKECLLRLLRDHESPWYFERWGSLRGRRSPYDFYATVRYQGEPAVFDYAASTEGLSKGKWLPDTGTLFAREGIEIDLARRGFLYPGDNPPPPFRHPFRKVYDIARSLW